MRAEREVLLAGGVINSPQVLMLSGIGDPEELRAHGIDVRVALPGVGRNLQDHVMAPVAYRRRTPGPFARNMRLDRIGTHVLNAHFRGKGFATELPAPLTAFLKTDSSLAMPDLQLLFHGGPLHARPYLPPFRPAFADGFSALAVVLRPESRGRVRLASADPAARGAHPPELPVRRPRLAHAARGAAAAPRPGAADGDRRRSRRPSSRPGRRSRATRSSMRTSAPSPSPCTTRSARAAWAWTATRWRW